MEHINKTKGFNREIWEMFGSQLVKFIRLRFKRE
jgi:hypothetical protein